MSLSLRANFLNQDCGRLLCPYTMWARNARELCLHEQVPSNDSWEVDNPSAGLSLINVPSLDVPLPCIISSLPTGVLISPPNKLSTVGSLCQVCFWRNQTQDSGKTWPISGLHIEQIFSEPPLCTKSICLVQYKISNPCPQAKEGGKGRFMKSFKL